MDDKIKRVRELRQEAKVRVWTMQESTEYLDLAPALADELESAKAESVYLRERLHSTESALDAERARAQKAERERDEAFGMRATWQRIWDALEAPGGLDHALSKIECWKMDEARLARVAHPVAPMPTGQVIEIANKLRKIAATSGERVPTLLAAANLLDAYTRTLLATPDIVLSIAQDHAELAERIAIKRKTAATDNDRGRVREAVLFIERNETQDHLAVAELLNLVHQQQATIEELRARLADLERWREQAGPAVEVLRDYRKCRCPAGPCEHSAMLLSVPLPEPPKVTQ